MVSKATALPTVKVADSWYIFWLYLNTPISKLLCEGCSVAWRWALWGDNSRRDLTMWVAQLWAPHSPFTLGKLVMVKMLVVIRLMVSEAILLYIMPKLWPERVQEKYEKWGTIYTDKKATLHSNCRSQFCFWKLITIKEAIGTTGHQKVVIQGINTAGSSSCKTWNTLTDCHCYRI